MEISFTIKYRFCKILPNDPKLWSDSSTSPFLSNNAKLLELLQLESKNKAETFSEECPFIYQLSAPLMLQISVFKVCHSLPTASLTGNVWGFLFYSMCSFEYSNQFYQNSVPDGAAEQDGVL